MCTLYLPALQRRKVEMLMVEDQSDASLGVVHVVLGRVSGRWHFRVNPSVGSSAGEKNFHS